MSNDVKIAFDFSKLDEIVEEFRRRGGNTAEVMPVIAEDMVTEVIERFDLQSGFEQGPWQELSDATLAARRASQDPQALKDTGNMWGSVTPFSGDDLAEAYTNVPYSKYHTSHDPRIKKADGSDLLPMRDFMDIDWPKVIENAGELLLAEMLT
jgi:phage gpG-like protein